MMHKYMNFAVAAFGMAMAAAQPVEAVNNAVDVAASRDLQLDRFADWIDQAGGGCCNKEDATIGLMVEPTHDTETPFRVLFTHTVKGVPLTQPKWVDIPARIVKDPAEVEAKCKPIVAQDRLQRKKTTCTEPPRGTLFATDNVQPRSDGQYDINGNPNLKLRPGDKMPTELWTITFKNCFFKGQALN